MVPSVEQVLLNFRYLFLLPGVLVLLSLLLSQYLSADVSHIRVLWVYRHRCRDIVARTINLPLHHLLPRLGEEASGNTLNTPHRHFVRRGEGQYILEFVIGIGVCGGSQFAAFEQHVSLCKKPLNLLLSPGGDYGLLLCCAQNLSQI